MCEIDVIDIGIVREKVGKRGHFGRPPFVPSKFKKKKKRERKERLFIFDSKGERVTFRANDSTSHFELLEGIPEIGDESKYCERKYFYF